MSAQDALDQAAACVREADLLVVAAGAGMGVDSGLPDFRGNEGFWKVYPALRGHSFVETANPRGFAQDPARAWGFYGHRLALYRRTQPHAGFGLLRQWGERLPLGVTVFTSNVDGQFQRAGFDEVYECHGSIHHLQCTTPCGEAIWPAEGFEPLLDETDCRLLNEPPRCPWCGALARPNILMFGDGAWLDARSAQQQLRLEARLREARRMVVVELGAGTAVPSVRHFSETLVHRRGARLVRINPREPQVPPGQIGLACGALEGLSRLQP
ncbi:SIR2 family NAD-dependent protein deacylase [Inhella proteolytica]|uniref:protein acetyllysine N-acetyltransferase n=1 Tax=Inhella proteolytica TaxID=2795029 RepID=A0A931NI35_9BURK|nr:NAD-dependent deacetylase [Inhella proteolytica]MBH9578433.1 NAD-dependent deacetylase [Inhella proteolytica]